MDKLQPIAPLLADLTTLYNIQSKIDQHLQQLIEKLKRLTDKPDEKRRKLVGAIGRLLSVDNAIDSDDRERLNTLIEYDGINPKFDVEITLNYCPAASYEDAKALAKAIAETGEHLGVKVDDVTTFHLRGIPHEVSRAVDYLHDALLSNPDVQDDIQAAEENDDLTGDISEVLEGPLLLDDSRTVEELFS